MPESATEVVVSAAAGAVPVAFLAYFANPELPYEPLLLDAFGAGASGAGAAVSATDASAAVAACGATVVGSAAAGAWDAPAALESLGFFEYFDRVLPPDPYEPFAPQSLPQVES